MGRRPARAERNTYTYDGLNRIRANATSTGHQSQTYTYRDLLGNIGTLSRHDRVPTATAWVNTQIDNLTYQYVAPKSSRLLAISDNSAHPAGYQAVSNANYAYDPNGNMTYDAQRGLTMTYNHLNLPSRTTMPNNTRVDNIYDANGVKWQRIFVDATGRILTRTYIAGMEFGPTGALDICHHSSGYVQVSNTQQAVAAVAYEWRYRITDHLGNTRALFSASTTSSQKNAGEGL